MKFEGQELIRMEQVEKRYGRQLVLKIEALSLKEGKRIVVTGANGSGKSTLLRLIGGITPEDNGRLLWAPALKLGTLGYLPQVGGLYGELSLKDNLILRSHLYGSKNTVLEKAWYIQDLGLGPFLGKRISDFSGGYQRLANIAATLHVEPTWLIFDEPFSGVDEGKRRLLIEGLTKIEQQIRLLVIAAQEPGEVPFANHQIQLRKGRILCSE